MKLIEFVAPVESMRGNLSGKQELQYAEHNNPAFEAPNGAQSAKNYQPRFIGAKRAKDGLKYFAVRTKQTCVLNSKTRNAMALTGSIASIKSAIQYGGTAAWSNLKSIYEYRKEHGGDAAGSGISFNKWMDYWLRQMLQYKQDSITISATGLSVIIKSPYTSYDTEATAISEPVFAKFVQLLTTDSGSVFFTVNGKQFAGSAQQWNDFKGEMNNANYESMFSDFTIPSADDGAVQYNGLQLYTSAGVAVKSSDTFIANEKYTTVPPEA